MAWTVGRLAALDWLPHVTICPFNPPSTSRRSATWQHGSDSTPMRWRPRDDQRARALRPPAGRGSIHLARRALGQRGPRDRGRRRRRDRPCDLDLLRGRAGPVARGRRRTALAACDALPRPSPATSSGARRAPGRRARRHRCGGRRRLGCSPARPARGAPAGAGHVQPAAGDRSPRRLDPHRPGPRDREAAARRRRPIGSGPIGTGAQPHHSRLSPRGAGDQAWRRAGCRRARSGSAARGTPPRRGADGVADLHAGVRARAPRGGTRRRPGHWRGSSLGPSGPPGAEPAAADPRPGQERRALARHRRAPRTGAGPARRWS